MDRGDGGEPLRWAELLRRPVLAASSGRRILGITGPPGAGKSTLARKIVAAVTVPAVWVPMDGFHLAGSELARLGRQDRKGAPDTFDAAGYLALLRRLRLQGPEVVYAPEFRREIEEPVAGAIPVPPEIELIVTEGNYLLLATPPWHQVRPLLDEVWYLDPPDPVRRARLIARHMEFGRDERAARAWVADSDEANARLIARTRDRADLVVGA